jgi:hypothetical protein
MQKTRKGGGVRSRLTRQDATGVEPGITGLNPNISKKEKKKIDQYINEMSVEAGLI